MEKQQVLDAQARAKSFLQAKWFPGAIASLALAISIGGHAFTALNSVGYAKMANKIDNLEAIQGATERADGNQDRAIQALQGELVKQARTIQALQTTLAGMRNTQGDLKADAGSAPAAINAVAQVTSMKEQVTKDERRHLPHGVSERFDNLIHSRMKLHWEEPPLRADAAQLGSDEYAVLQFAVDRQGWITDVQVASTSGAPDFDNSAVKAALRMNSIPEIARLNDQAYSQIRVFRLAITPASMR
jgi:TonB family protein